MANKINFTKASLDALPVPEKSKRIEFADSRQFGLRLRVTSTGVKTFSVLKRIKGSDMERITLDRYPAMSIEQARKKTVEILGKMAEGNNPAEIKRSLKTELTFSQLFVEYGERHGNKKKAWRDDQQRFRDYLVKPLGSKKLSTITREMIGRILSDMDRDGKAGATVNNVRALASGIFGKAIEWNLLKDNPVKGIKTRPSKQRDRFLLAAELPRFFTSLDQELNKTIRDYFMLSLLTGARRSNVLAMQWSHVNLGEGTWRIPDTKNGTPQMVTLSPPAIELLEMRSKVAENGFVFPGTGKSKHLEEPKKGWQRIFDRDELAQVVKKIENSGNTFIAQNGDSLNATLKNAKLLATHLKINTEGCRMIDIRIHDLRRTLGSWQAITGSSMLIIGKSLNHLSSAATAIYARLDLDPVRASVNKATEAMLEAGSTKKLVGISE